jgi:hypothetical protein
MDALIRDLRYTLRSFRGSLKLSLAAVGCVALGTGGAVFILTIANAVLLEAPPFPDAHRLVRIWTVREGSEQRDDVSYLDVRDIEARARATCENERLHESLPGAACSAGSNRLGAPFSRPSRSRR